MHYTVSDLVLELVENAVAAKASLVEVDFDENGPWIEVRVADDGVGMDAAGLARLEDPFGTDGNKHPHRRVGLGFPFLRQTAEATGGTVAVESAPGAGTTVRFRLDAGHLDTPPTGELPGLWLASLSYSGDHEMVIRRGRRAGGAREAGGDPDYELRRSEVLDALGDLDSVASLTALRDYLRALEEADDTDNDGR